MLSEEAVIWGYRYILGREPESRAVIEANRACETVQDFRSALLQSAEFHAISSTGISIPKWVIAEIFAGQRRMWVNLSDPYISYPCLMDSYEPHETDLIRGLLQAGDTFVDIGANIGWFSLLASTIVGPDGRILAFEPQPTTFEKLSQSFKLNALEDIARAFQAGLSNSKATMNLASAAGDPNPGGSHIVPDGNVRPGHNLASVELLPLDSLNLAAVNFIKIDVEGAELMALEGARQTILAHMPYILSEIHTGQLRSVSGCSPADYVRWVCALGYDCIAIDGRTRRENGTLLNDASDADFGVICNVLFTPRARTEAFLQQM